MCNRCLLYCLFSSEQIVVMLKHYRPGRYKRHLPNYPRQEQAKCDVAKSRDKLSMIKYPIFLQIMFFLHYHSFECLGWPRFSHSVVMFVVYSHN